MTSVRAVLGDQPANQLGRVDYHEHLFQVSPLLPGDELTDEVTSTREAELLRASGFQSMVDATPTGLGRDPAGLARISAATGLSILASTGAHREEHYGASHWLIEKTTAQLARRFVTDVQLGMPQRDQPTESQPAFSPTGKPVRAGVIKTGIGYWSISAFEHRVIEAVAEAHGQTGAPVMVHLEYGSAAFEVLDLLARSGVEASSVVLAHIDRNPDPGLHAELAARGAYLGYDGVARHKSWPDSVVLTCLLEAASRGANERVILGGDVARRTRYNAAGGMPGLAYLGDRFVPRMIEAGGKDLAHMVLEANPQRWAARFS
jgi:predicted metal-dependent phosphotriesterase family hydrolase